MDTQKHTSASARTYKVLLGCAIEISQKGHLPTLIELALATETSRATVYRYFPSHADLVHALMTHSLSNLIAWRPRCGPVSERVTEAIDLLFKNFRTYETLFRAVLQLSLLPDTQDQDTSFSIGQKNSRGLRIEILKRALEPLVGHMDSVKYEQLLKNLSLVFGIEALVVLRDIFGLNLDDAREAILASAQAFIRDAVGKASWSKDVKELLK